MKAGEVHKMSVEELGVEVAKLRNDLYDLRTQAVTEKVEDTSKFKKLKKIPGDNVIYSLDVVPGVALSDPDQDGRVRVRIGSATAVLSGGGPSCSLVSPAFVAASGSLPPGVSFPDGLFQFQASGCTGSVTLTVTFPTAFAAGVQYWKYGPTPGQASDHWYTLGAANGLSLAGHVATFTIADGGLGDDDLSVNGTIIDAGGPSLAAVAPQSAIPAPMFDSRSLAALIALLALCGAAALRTQRKASP